MPTEIPFIFNREQVSVNHYEQIMKFLGIKNNVLTKNITDHVKQMFKMFEFLYRLIELYID